MKSTTPHYLLFAEGHGSDGSGRWRFLLRSVDGSERFEASDIEPEIHGERLDLLTVVRALESLDQPSRVTLVGCSRYVRQGMQYGLVEWRDNGWRWESFGELVPVKNSDLWQRVDRAMRFHRVECRQRRFDPPHPTLPAPRATEARQVVGRSSIATNDNKKISLSRSGRVGYLLPLRLPRWRLLWSALLRSWRRRTVRSWTVLKPEFPVG